MPVAHLIPDLQPLFQHLREWEFVEVGDLVPGFDAPGLPKYVIVKVLQPVALQSITVSPESIKTPLLTLHYVYSAGLIFAYLLEISNFKISVRPNFVSIMRPIASKETKFTDVEIASQNAHISVLHSEDGASIVVFNSRFSNLNPDIVKGGSGI